MPRCEIPLIETNYSLNLRVLEQPYIACSIVLPSSRKRVPVCSICFKNKLFILRVCVNLIASKLNMRFVHKPHIIQTCKHGSFK